MSNTPELLEESQMLNRIKTVISGYLMDISNGRISKNGEWIFPNQERFDIDLSHELALQQQAHELNDWKVEECRDFLVNQPGISDEIRFKYVCAVIHAEKIIPREVLLKALAPTQSEALKDTEQEKV